MKNLNLLVLFVFISSNLFCQGELKSNNELNKFRIGIFYSLDKNLSSENFFIDKHAGYSANYNLHNYSTGINLEYELNNGLSINSGLNYSNKNFYGTFFCVTCEFIVDQAPEKIKLQFLEIPISIRYYFLSRKTRYFAEAGFINQFIISSEKVQKNYLLNGKLGVGIEFIINKKLAGQIAIEYSKGLTNLFDNSAFKNEVIGFRLGIIKRL